MIFGVLIRDFSAGAVSMHGRTGSTQAQQEWALGAIRKPVIDSELFDRVWGQVVSLADAYSMTP
jgi:acyl-CoA dehydrogenase